MNIPEFSYILAVLDHGGFAKAAETIYISQPSLSLYIKNLENRLGISFFEKKKGKYVLNSEGKYELTPEGALYVDYARQIVKMNNDLMTDLEIMKNRKSRTIRIGMTATRGEILLPSLLRAFKKSHPDLRVEIIINRNKKLIEDTLNKNLDMILIHKPVTSYDLQYINLFSEEVIVAINKENPVCLKAKSKDPTNLSYRYIAIEDLKEIPFVLFEEGRWLRKIADNLFNEYKITPNVLHETTTASSAYQLVSSGFAASFLVDSDFKTYLVNDNVEFFLIDNYPLKANYVIAYPDNTQLTELVREAIVVIKELFSKE